jgi:hypothetical protein
MWNTMDPMAIYDDKFCESTTLLRRDVSDLTLGGNNSANGKVKMK